MLLLLNFLIALVYSDVLVLDDSNFSETLQKHERVLVEFYAPWCGHCKALEPEYKNAAQQIEDDDSINAVLAKVDATAEVNKQLAERMGLEGYPTLYLFTNGDETNKISYQGARKANAIVDWLANRQSPAFVDLNEKSVDEIQEFQKEAASTLIGYIANDNKEAAEEFKTATDSLRENLKLGLVTDDNKIKELGEEPNTVFLYKKNEATIKYTGAEITYDSLSGFVKSEKLPFFQEITYENFMDYQDAAMPLVWLGANGDKVEVDENDQSEEPKEKITPMDDATRADLDKLTTIMTNLAKEFKGKLLFGWTNALQEENKSFLEGEMGMTAIPGVVVFDLSTPEGNGVFNFKGDIYSETEVRAFLKDFEEGKLEVFVKTAEPPTTNPDGNGVWTLVGSTVTDFRAKNKDKDLLIEYYASWCPHCKALTPIYEEFSRVFKSYDGIVIAKIDADANSIAGETIEGYPTLIYYRAGSNDGEPVEAGDYNTESGFSVDYLVTYIKQNSKVDTSDVPMPEFDPNPQNLPEDAGDDNDGELDGEFDTPEEFDMDNFDPNDPESGEIPPRQDL